MDDKTKDELIAEQQARIESLLAERGRLVDEASRNADMNNQQAKRIYLLEDELCVSNEAIDHLHNAIVSAEQRGVLKADEEIKQLAAQNEVLRGQLIKNKDLIRCGIGANYGGDCYYKKLDSVIGEIDSAISESPAASLSEHDAELLEQYAEKTERSARAVAEHEVTRKAFEVVAKQLHQEAERIRHWATEDLNDPL